MVEKALIRKMLKELDKYLKQLIKYRGTKISELEEEIEKLWSIEHGLQLAIQTVLDIGNHILADEGIAVNKYAEIFKELTVLNIIPTTFAQKMEPMAGFRNILVYANTEVNLKELTNILNNDLNDFKEYAKYIEEYLEEKG